MLSRWCATVGHDGTVKHPYEEFTFDEDSSVCEDRDAGWLVTLTMVYGTPEKHAKELILEFFTDWKSRHQKSCKE